MALAWILSVPTTAWGDTVILQIQVLEGEGGVFPASGRALKPITVRVTSETGAPIAGAAVSFRLPEEGVTGIFQNGLKTDIALSGPDGRAVSPNITWGPLAGPARLRVTAALDEARAGVLVAVYISADNVVVAGASSAIAPQQQRFDPAAAPRLKKSRRWLRLLIAVAGGTAAGVGLAFAKKSGGGVKAAPGPAISIGQPTISIGRTLP